MTKYEKNKQSLQHNEGFVKWLESDKDPDWFEVKNKNLIIKKSNKVRLAYPDEYLDEIKKIKEQKIFYKDTATIIVGIGLGKLLYSVLKSMDKGHHVIVVEPVPAMARAAFDEYDFSKWFKSNELIIANTREGIGQAIGMLDGTLVIQDWLTLSESYIMWCEEYSELFSATMEFVDQHRCGVGTVMGAGPIIAENDIKNFPYIITHRGVKDLKNLYEGKPCISVTTGPSLTKNLYLLKEIQDDVIIIAVAQALRVLLAYGIRPDFITTVDYGEVNHEHFKGLMDENVPLVALNRTYAKILKHYSGPKFIVGTPVPGHGDSIHEIIENKGTLEQGGSVVHLSYQLAKHLGCDPITLIGHNLSYENNLSHTPHADAGGKIEIDGNGLIKWDVDDPRSSLHKLESSHGRVMQFPGYFDEPVYTNVGLASFITTFESFFENESKTIINSTEGGVKLKGAFNMTLQRFIDEYVCDKIDKSKILELFDDDPELDKNIIKAIDAIERDIKSLKNLSEYAEIGIEAADKMIVAGNDKKEYSKWAKENETYANKAHDIARKNPLIGLHIYSTNRKIYSKELKVKGTNQNLLKNLDDRQIRVNRSKMILEAARDAAERLRPFYEEVFELLIEYDNTKDKKLLQSEIKEDYSIFDSNKYFSKGNWTHPLNEANKIINRNEFGFNYVSAKYIIRSKAERMRIAEIEKAKNEARTERRQDKLDYIELIDKAQNAGKNHRDYKKVIELLEEAKDLFPEKYAARWGLATTNALLHNEDDAIKEYESLIEDFPDNLRLKYECGIVMIGIDAQKGIKMIQDVMSKTDEFNNFYLNLGDLYFGQGNMEEAKECYETYLEYYPGDYQAKDKLKACK